MRELKFRAWNKKKTLFPMTYNIELGYARVDFRRHKLMQYTGLKDKNGKEIYEGDIVKNYIGQVGTIIWVKKTCGFEIDMKCIGRHGIQKRLEIIGNIYENPELIKETNAL